MSLSSGGWTHTPGYTPDQSAALPSHYAASQSQLGCQTVLMSVRVSVCHSGIRPLCLPGAGDESLRLQLSMDPGKSGEFRLSLQDSSGTGRSVVSWFSCCGNVMKWNLIWVGTSKSSGFTNFMFFIFVTSFLLGAIRYWEQITCMTALLCFFIWLKVHCVSVWQRIYSGLCNI